MPTIDTAQRVGREVRAEMVRAAVTQSDLAKVLGKSQTAVSRRLSGEVPFDVNEVLAIATWLDVPASDLLGRMPRDADAA